jgi:hypothetical protein
LINSEAARKDASEEHQTVKLSTYGILLMGSPYEGAAGVRPRAPVVRNLSIFITPDNKAEKHIKPGSDYLGYQVRQYASISQDFVYRFAYDEVPADLGRRDMVCGLHEISSADIDPTRQVSAVVAGASDTASLANHVNMVKFSSREDVTYKKVSEYLQMMVENAPGIIRAHWHKMDKIENGTLSK